MTISHAIILGLVQGLGEFLPISSSAHLILIPWFFNFPDPGLSFDVALHFCTLIAIVLYFWRDWIDIIKLAFTGKNTSDRYEKNILWLVIIATIPGAIFGALLESKAETIFRNPLLLAFTLVIMGFLLYLADKKTKGKKNLQNFSLKDSVFIGCSQALAIIPGISRAGSTITTGLFLGLDRVSAARFSFLLSTPIIFGATALKAKHLLSANPTEITAIIIATISGYFAITWMLKFISRVSYKVFFWYRLVLAIIIVALWFIK